MVLGMEIGLSPGDFVLDGDPALSPKTRRSPPTQFSAHFYSGQTAGCIKMPLGMEVGVNPGDFVLDGASAKLCGGEQRAPSIFGRAAITLGIGPHSSSFFLMVALWNRADHYIFILFMVALCNRADHYIFILFLLSFFLFYFLA